ncbi:MAG TPA: energy transducer TonB [Terracidiphilus sp.]|jgi:TonB family protein|nr:energy transducer TonB [Terracidiphilus sp.]
MRCEILRNFVRGWRRTRGGVLAGIAVLVVGFAALTCIAEQRAVKQKIAPVYPEIAKRLHVTGIVKLEVTVDGDGKVIAVKAVSGNEMLSDAAAVAVQKWKFAPGPDVSTFTLDVHFDLAQ